MADDVIIAVDGHVAPWLVVADNVIVAVAQTLSSAELNVDVANHMQVAIS